MIVTSSFHPSPWFKNPHLQTIWPALYPITSPRTVRERLELPDGDFVDIDWVNHHLSAPTIICLHGFEGSSRSHYVKRLMQHCETKNWRCAVLHFRGCSGEPNRLPRAYHSGETQDFRFLLKHVSRQNKGIPLYAIGYSLGGNVLLKYLGEEGKTAGIQAAIAVSVPYQLQIAAHAIDHGFARIYQQYLLSALLKRLQHKTHPLAEKIDIQLMKKIKTIYQFDDLVTAPIHGFDSADDYYLKASSKEYLTNIKIPTLLIHAKDDPFMTEDVIPLPNELSLQTRLELSAYGGHVGFVAGGNLRKPIFWLEERINSFLEEHIAS